MAWTPSSSHSSNSRVYSQPLHVLANNNSNSVGPTDSPISGHIISNSDPPVLFNSDDHSSPDGGDQFMGSHEQIEPREQGSQANRDHTGDIVHAASEDHIEEGVHTASDDHSFSGNLGP
ncbi:hypothetical protein V6N13_147592 [Hibiscus sabdariffa]|uniref:Uncharacterized protein n=1 Tax=Hibiscus sabdariffa TaxID=183260 RepID=A0ABR2TWN1_9ROSI